MRVVGVYRCARAARTGLGLRITTFGETHGRISTMGASRKQRHCLGSAALVAVVQTTDFPDFDDVAQAGRVDGSRLRGVFAEGEMSSRFVVVGKYEVRIRRRCCSPRTIM